MSEWRRVQVERPRASTSGGHSFVDCGGGGGAADGGVLIAAAAPPAAVPSAIAGRVLWPDEDEDVGAVERFFFACWVKVRQDAASVQRRHLFLVSFELSHDATIS